MNKQTLSHYGWIIVVVIIIAILLGCAASFATGIKVNFINITNRLTNEMDEGFDIVNKTEGDGTLALTITAPESNDPDNPTQVETSAFTTYGTAIASAGIKSLTVNGIAVTVAADGTWNLPLTLTKGEVTPVTVVLTDNNDDVISETRYVQCITAYALVLEVNFSGYSTAVHPIILLFVNSADEIVAGDTYASDLCGEATVLQAYTGFLNEKYTFNEETHQVNTPWSEYATQIMAAYVEDEMSPTSTSCWFAMLHECVGVELTLLDVSGVEDMSYMFYRAGEAVNNLSVYGLDVWDTSSATNMQKMFAGVAGFAEEFVIDISNWNTSSVTDMSGMFDTAAQHAEIWSVGDISKWDTSSVVDMSSMFHQVGGDASCSLDLSKWNVAKVTSRDSFNEGIKSNIIAPMWKN